MEALKRAKKAAIGDILPISHWGVNFNREIEVYIAAKYYFTLAVPVSWIRRARRARSQAGLAHSLHLGVQWRCRTSGTFLVDVVPTRDLRVQVALRF